MTKQSFSLIPFPTPNLPSISLKGEISRKDNILNLNYSLAGKVEDVFLPPISTNPSRKDELWMSTCFECFLAIKDQPEYWEFNMSPSGDWNAYHMDAYRRVGFRKETSVQHLQFKTQQEAGVFSLGTAIHLNLIIGLRQLLEIGITAVIQTKNGDETYWALAHPESYPDFHLRESFILALAGQTHLAGQSVRDD
jgi:hypothetical protein